MERNFFLYTCGMKIPWDSAFVRFTPKTEPLERMCCCESPSIRDVQVCRLVQIARLHRACGVNERICGICYWLRPYAELFRMEFQWIVERSTCFLDAHPYLDPYVSCCIFHTYDVTNFYIRMFRVRKPLCSGLRVPVTGLCTSTRSSCVKPHSYA